MATSQSRAESPTENKGSRIDIPERKEHGSLLDMTGISLALCIGHDTICDSLRSYTRDEEEGEIVEIWEGVLDEEQVFEKNIRRFFDGVRCVKILIVLLAIEVSLLDPLFFYIPVINDRQKCVRLDKKLGTAVMVSRSVIDFFYVIYIVSQLHVLFSVPYYRKYRYIRSRKILLIDFLAVLPLPQVVILIIPAMRGSRFLNAMYLLRSVVLCQFVPRCFRAYVFITSGTFGEPAKARVKFSPFIFLLGIDVSGALWYFLSVERLLQCWTKACETHAGCVNSFHCKDNIGDHISLKDFCPMDTQKTAFFDFGIFSDALQYRVVEMTYFPKKFLYCFQWGLQNLSGFGQNLKTSTSIWESLFAISMSILGMLLFLLLIGNVQTFMESERKERDKKRLKAIESIENWLPLEKLSLILKQDIKKHLKYYSESKTTDPSIILLELPTDLKRSVERELGLESLKKVNVFKGVIRQNLLDGLSKSIELKLFDEGQYIVQEGDKINKMVFVVHGKLEVFSSPGERNLIKVLKDGDFCGEEVTWDVFNDWPSELPLSTMTIKAFTRVLALVLRADAVRDSLRSLPVYVKSSIRNEFCFDFLDKVKAFKPIGENERDYLSKFMKLQLFKEGEFIMKEGERINNMVYILQGKLEADSSLSDISSSNILKHGDVFGEEVTWDVFTDRWSSDNWGSTMTTKARTKVHALVLPARRVIDFLACFPNEMIRIRHELCFGLLKKVKAFKPIDENERDYLSKCMKLQLFKQGAYIMQEGKPINNMVFILQGKLEVVSSLSDVNSISILKHGDVCGEEVTWVVFNDLWESTTTTKARTRVHAIVLPAETVRKFLGRLPNKMKRSIRHEFCFDLLKQVRAFKAIGQDELDDLSESIELHIFSEGEYIMQEGKPINCMVFIEQGTREVHSSSNKKDTSKVVKDGELCGEEVTWDVFNDWSSVSELPNSTVTIKAITRVKALVLPADKVRHFLRCLPNDLKRRIRLEFENDEFFNSISTPSSQLSL